MANAPSIAAFPSTVSGNASIIPAAPMAVPVQQAPPELILPKLPVSIEGYIISSNPKMQEIRIQTGRGEVLVQSAVNLPPDTKVSVRVYTDKNRTLADIVLLQQKIVSPPQSEKMVSLPEKPVPVPNLLEGQTVMAFLLQKQPANFTPVDIQDDMPPSNNILQKVLSSKHSFFQQLLSVCLPQVLVSKQESQKIPSYAGITEKAVSQKAAFVPQDMYQLNILKIFPPDAAPEKIKIALQKIELSTTKLVKVETPALLSAKVETTTPVGSPILKTPEYHFVVKTPVRVPVGSSVIFKAEIVTPETGIKDISYFQSFGASFLVFGDTWPALHEAVQVLAPSTSSAAQAFRNTIPTPTPHFVPTTLFFLAALRLGSIESWLGENTLRSLQQAGKKELAERLGSDFGKLSSLSKETLADGWRSIPVPLLYDDQLSQMQFYVRRQYDQDGENKEDGVKPATRFILNLHLSRIGEMQLDGFVRKKNFDIILRTEEKLPFNMRQELMKRFAQGLDQVRMQGKISFQIRQESWVTVSLPQQSGVVL